MGKGGENMEPLLLVGYIGGLLAIVHLLIHLKVQNKKLRYWDVGLWCLVGLLVLVYAIAFSLWPVVLYFIGILLWIFLGLFNKGHRKTKK